MNNGAIINDRNRLSKTFFKDGVEIVAVGGNVNSAARLYEPCFQICGTAWADGLYSRSRLIEMGADADELDSIYSADCVAHDELIASMS